jgi:hypothetical protein
MAWVNQEAWVSTAASPQPPGTDKIHDLSHWFYPNFYPEFKLCNWRLIETGAGLIYGTGHVDGSGIFIVDTNSGLFPAPPFIFTNTFLCIGYMQFQIDDVPICWSLTFALKTGQKRSIHGPGRYPSSLIVPKDIDMQSCILIEDGIEIKRNKYKLTPPED